MLSLPLCCVNMVAAVCEAPRLLSDKTLALASELCVWSLAWDRKSDWQSLPESTERTSGALSGGRPE